MNFEPLAKNKLAAIDAFRYLVGLAMSGGVCGPSLQRVLSQGKQPPDRMLPGRLIDYISKEERAALKYLTADLIVDTPSSIYATHGDYSNSGRSLSELVEKQRKLIKRR